MSQEMLTAKNISDELFFAMQAGDVDAVASCLQSETVIHHYLMQYSTWVCPRTGNTFLHYAMWTGNPLIIAQFIEDASGLLRNKDGQSCFEMAPFGNEGAEIRAIERTYRQMSGLVGRTSGFRLREFCSLLAAKEDPCAMLSERFGYFKGADLLEIQTAIFFYGMMRPFHETTRSFEIENIEEFYQKFDKALVFLLRSWYNEKMFPPFPDYNEGSEDPIESQLKVGINQVRRLLTQLDISLDRLPSVALLLPKIETQQLAQEDVSSEMKEEKGAAAAQVAEEKILSSPVMPQREVHSDDVDENLPQDALSAVSNLARLLQMQANTPLDNVSREGGGSPRFFDRSSAPPSSPQSELDAVVQEQDSTRSVAPGRSPSVTSDDE